MPEAGRLDVVEAAEEPAHVDDRVAVVVHDLLAVRSQLVVPGPRTGGLGERRKEVGAGVPARKISFVTTHQ